MSCFNEYLQAYTNFVYQIVVSCHYNTKKDDSFQKLILEIEFIRYFLQNDEDFK